MGFSDLSRTILKNNDQLRKQIRSRYFVSSTSGQSQKSNAKAHKLLPHPKGEQSFTKKNLVIILAIILSGTTLGYYGLQMMIEKADFILNRPVLMYLLASIHVYALSASGNL